MGPLNDLVQALQQEFRQRDDVIRGLLLGLLTKSNVLLIGPPGTAKSLLVNSMVQKIAGVKYFSYLMTKFTRPDEIIGPISLQGLEKDEFVRVLDGRLADVHIGFLDEVFNSNSGCLNATLNIINEKKILNGTKLTEVPLMMLVGASNSLPAETTGELSAFYDRFLLRYELGYLSTAQELKNLINLEPCANKTALMSIEDIIFLQNRVLDIELPLEVISRLVAIVIGVRQKGVAVSDRRVRQSCLVVKAEALLEGRTRACLEDLYILKDIFWNTPRDREIFAEIWTAFQKPVLERLESIIAEASEIYADLTGVNWHFAKGTEKGTRLMELKQELQSLLHVYGSDLELAREIGSRVDKIDSLMTTVLKNMAAAGGTQRYES